MFLSLMQWVSELLYWHYLPPNIYPPEDGSGGGGGL